MSIGRVAGRCVGGSCGGRVAVARAPINAGWAVGVTQTRGRGVCGGMESRSRARAETQTARHPPSRRATCAVRALDVSRLDTPRVGARAPGARAAATVTREHHATSLYTPAARLPMPLPSHHTAPSSPLPRFA
jgi:hypothetical protein